MRDRSRPTARNGIPQEENTSCSPDLVICDDITEFFTYIAHGFEDRITALFCLSLISRFDARDAPGKG